MSVEGILLRGCQKLGRLLERPGAARRGQVNCSRAAAPHSFEAKPSSAQYELEPLSSAKACHKSACTRLACEMKGRDTRCSLSLSFRRSSRASSVPSRSEFSQTRS